MLIICGRPLGLFFVFFITIFLSSSKCFAGEGSKENTDSKKIPGIWFDLGMDGLWVEDPKTKNAHTTKEQKEALQRLDTLGYLSGYKKASNRSGITSYDNQRAYDGYNLYLSGHKAEAILMDMHGVVLHRWSYDYDLIKGAARPKSEISNKHYKKYWRGVHLLGNGDLYAIYDYLGLIKLDKSSNMHWFYPGKAHHDLDLSNDGKVYTLIAEDKIIPRLNAQKAIREDFICVLDKDGNEIERVSLIECFENSSYGSFLPMVAEYGGDIFHTNAIVIIKHSFEDRHSAFKPGNVLVSIRNLSALVVVDIKKRSVEWGLQGFWEYQHDPRVLPNGNVLLFDNTGYQSFSRVAEVDPFKTISVWHYVGDPPSSFSSEYCGTVQRLANGNTLITETCSGRAFEVTHNDKKIVWEFYNPHRAGEDNELVAALLEVIRLDSDFPHGWLGEKP